MGMTMNMNTAERDTQQPEKLAVKKAQKVTDKKQRKATTASERNTKATEMSEKMNQADNLEKNMASLALDIEEDEGRSRSPEANPQVSETDAEEGTDVPREEGKPVAWATVPVFITGESTSEDKATQCCRKNPGPPRHGRQMMRQIHSATGADGPHGGPIPPFQGRPIEGPWMQWQRVMGRQAQMYHNMMRKQGHGQQQPGEGQGEAQGPPQPWKQWRRFMKEHHEQMKKMREDASIQEPQEKPQGPPEPWGQWRRFIKEQREQMKKMKEEVSSD